MLNYQPGFGPSAPPPARLKPFLGQVPLAPVFSVIPFQKSADLGRSPKMAQTFDEIAGLPRWSGDVLRVIFHGGTTWLGIRVGLQSRDKWVAGIAWVLGIGNGLAGIADLISLVKRATGTHPPEPGKETPPVATARSF